MREVPIPPHITILFVEQEVRISDPASTIRSRDPPDRWRRHCRLGFGAEG